VIPLFRRPLVARASALVEDESFKPTEGMFHFLKCLHDRTGGTGGLLLQVDNNVTAVGGSQGTAYGVSKDITEVLHGSGAGVRLAVVQPSQQMWVFNGSGGNINVYPPALGQVDALIVNNPYVLANGKTQLFTCYSVLASGGRFFRSLQLG
jgi:hypothetical protein